VTAGNAPAQTMAQRRDRDQRTQRGAAGQAADSAIVAQQSAAWSPVGDMAPVDAVEKIAEEDRWTATKTSISSMNEASLLPDCRYAQLKLNPEKST